MLSQHDCGGQATILHYMIVLYAFILMATTSVNLGLRFVLLACAAAADDERRRRGIAGPELLARELAEQQHREAEDAAARTPDPFGEGGGAAAKLCDTLCFHLDVDDDTAGRVGKRDQEGEERVMTAAELAPPLLTMHGDPQASLQKA